MTQISAIKRVSKAGNSFGLYLTKELKLLGVKEGDVVQVTITTKEE